MSVMQIYQVDSSQLRTVDWTIDGKGKSLVKLEHWVLDQNLAMSVSALCHGLCGLQPMKNSLCQAGMSEAHLKPWIFQKILLDFRDPKKEP